MTGLRYLAGALALCCLFASEAFASDAPCATRQTLLAFVSERFPRAQVTVLQKSEAQAFLAAIRKIAPAAALAADEIVIVDASPEAPAVRVVLFEAGCMTRLGNLPRPVVRTILLALARNRA